MTDAGARHRLEHALRAAPRRIVACSGGIDSLVLATVAHRVAPSETVVAHAVSPAVPEEATARVVESATSEGWHLELVQTGEFDDERYLSNPTNRCYFCKGHLYEQLDALPARLGLAEPWAVLSGANADDLGEYRPGLLAAADHGVRHPYVEGGLGKGDIRSIARDLGLAYSELPASPCLASRLYTGTRVTTPRLRAVEGGEALIRRETGIAVVRCRVREHEALVEVADADRSRISALVLERVAAAMRIADPTITAVRLDERAYRPGRAILELR